MHSKMCALVQMYIIRQRIADMKQQADGLWDGRRMRLEKVYQKIDEWGGGQLRRWKERLIKVGFHPPSLPPLPLLLPGLHSTYSKMEPPVDVAHADRRTPQVLSAGTGRRLPGCRTTHAMATSRYVQPMGGRPMETAAGAAAERRQLVACHSAAPGNGRQAFAGTQRGSPDRREELGRRLDTLATMPCQRCPLTRTAGCHALCRWMNHQYCEGRARTTAAGAR